MLTPIKYGITETIRREGDYAQITIGYVPPFISCIGDKPAYWYISRQTRNMEQYKQGLRVDYWSVDGWACTTPIQYETPELAYAAYLKEIA